jgi:hypothetical protein
LVLLEPANVALLTQVQNSNTNLAQVFIDYTPYAQGGKELRGGVGREAGVEINASPSRDPMGVNGVIPGLVGISPGRISSEREVGSAEFC